MLRERILHFVQNDKGKSVRDFKRSPSTRHGCPCGKQKERPAGRSPLCTCMSYLVPLVWTTSSWLDIFIPSLSSNSRNKLLLPSNASTGRGSPSSNLLSNASSLRENDLPCNLYSSKASHATGATACAQTATWLARSRISFWAWGSILSRRKWKRL